ncbi:unnamed protein product [Schistocephalus solidus]|uniref:Transcription factor 25 n=1 Tax=Schistocephalus solidus TaxID=70667 RepID=A0A183SQV0_SCHSO|nr:unnamed protein product [Schistocephalus solidus]
MTRYKKFTKAGVSPAILICFGLPVEAFTDVEMQRSTFYYITDAILVPDGDSQTDVSSRSKAGSAEENEDILLERAQIPQSPPPVTSAVNRTDVLAFNKRLLDFRAELQKHFGPATTGIPSSTVNREFRGAFGALVRAQSTWPPLVRCGLDMDYSIHQNSFVFVHTKEYARQQRAFYALQDSFDPNHMSLLLSKAPYHVDTLLQMSEYLMHSDNSEVAVDLLERALYVLQSAFHLSFNFSTGNCKLDYRIQSNRSLYIALFRYIFYIATRSCYRAALEYSKLLLLLDPQSDPLAILLAVDFFAIAAEDYEFLLNLYAEWNPSRSLHLLPNFAFSIPLVHWMQRFRPRRRAQPRSELSAEEINLMLQDALIMFPGFLPRLMKHTHVGGTNNLDKSLLFGKEVLLSESEALGRLLDVYVSQCHYYWQEPDVLAWLEVNVEAVLRLVEPVIIPGSSTSACPNVEPDPRLRMYSEKRKSCYLQAPRNVLRYLFLRELPEAPLLLPPNHGSQKIYPLDPFPPLDSINSYDPEAERFLHRQPAGSGGFFHALFSSLWPSTSTTDDNEDIADIHALIAELGLHMEEVQTIGEQPTQIADTEDAGPPNNLEFGGEFD